MNFQDRAAKPMIDPLLVREYLLDNPGFFDRYPEMLTNLRMPHPEKGTVSLIERQQQVLRDRVRQLEDEITALLTNAARNEEVHRFYSKLLFDLLAIDNLDAMAQELQIQLRDHFRFINVKLYRRRENGQFSVPEMANVLNKRLDKRGYYLGRLPASEARLLVQIETGSVALVGLGEPDNWLGVLAIASHDPRHFAPDMGTMLLDNLQQMLTHRLRHG